jgi:hypothetical protein
LRSNARWHHVYCVWVALLDTMQPLEEGLPEIDDPRAGAGEHVLSRYIPLLIAAHAYATGATIVTANTDEFRRIRGLNWLA